MSGILVVLSGPSGAGKDTVMKKLNPQKGYALSVSATTRRPREGETEGRDYFFKSEAEFNGMIEAGELLEYANYVNNYYGTPKRYVEDMIAEGKAVLLEIEVEGALQVKSKYPEAVMIFIMPPTLTELKRRLDNRRTENAETVERRLKKAADEALFICRYDYIVINDDISKAADKIDSIVAAELLRTKRCDGLVDVFLNN